MRSLVEGFCSSSARYPDRPALEVGGERLTYRELDGRAAAVAAAIWAHAAPGPLAAMLAYRSAAAYVGVLGILASARGYVPLNPSFPAQRSRAMLQHSGCDTIVAGPEGAPTLRDLLQTTDRSVTVVSLGLEDLPAWQAEFPRHRFVLPDADARRIDPGAVAGVPGDATAYLLFTSGSTGVPKGVPVSQGNVASYIHYVSDRYRFVPEDRFSQTFDMTFDLSVHDMFVCWSSGACLVSMPHSVVMSPARFIPEKQLTVWFSVPSVVMMMQRLRSLRKDQFPGLRLSLFCGEPLLASWADAWQQAAPNSIVENVYGPTEATIAISHYRWNPTREANRCAHDVVPIGTVFGTQRAAVVNGDRMSVARGTPGELCLSGSQVTRGYLNDPDKTRQQFVTLQDRTGTWYRTGDLVSEGEDGVLQYHGRVDHQVQIYGHRVELQEIDHALRAAAGTDAAMAVAWPLESGRAEAVYAFVCAGAGVEPERIIAECQKVLPSYMVPKAVFVIDSMPVNANGKIDRKKLAETVGSKLHERR